jgi:non-specific serine/threonine protein kinase
MLFGRPVCDAGLWGAAERLREAIGAPLPPNEQRRRERQVAVARAALGDDAAFDRAWQEGRAMTLEQAIAGALRLEDDR